MATALAHPFEAPLAWRRRVSSASASPTPISIGDVAGLVARRALPGNPLIVGLIGSVASGKTTLALAIAAKLAEAHSVEIISTDGFLLSNAALAAGGLAQRKGYPESYDIAWMSGLLQRVRFGPVAVPGYSQEVGDVDPSLNRTIDRPDIVLVEGLGLAPRSGRRDPYSLLDVAIYLDASEADLETWFVARFMQLWRAGRVDAMSFDEAGVSGLARKLWTSVNLPNLRENISLARDSVDILLRKAPDHSLSLVRSAG